MFTWVTGLAVLIMGIIAAMLSVYLVMSNRNAVPPVFTPRRALDEVIEALDLPKTGRLYDLGCGDGRVLQAVLRQQPNLKVVGVENNPVVWMIAKLRLGGRAEVMFGHIEDVKLAAAERIFAYLGPGMMADLEPRFERELPKGAKVVSQQFPLPKRQPDYVVELKHGKAYAKTLYVYEY